MFLANWSHYIPLNSFPSVLDPYRLVSLIDTLHVCLGNPEAFTTLCNSRNGHIDGRVKAFHDTYYPVRMNGQHYSSTM